MSNSQRGNNNSRGWRGGYRGRGGFRGRGNWRGNSYGQSSQNQHGHGQTQSQQRPIVGVQMVLRDPSPYKGWKLYFPNEEFNVQSETVKKLEVFEKYILSWKQSYNFDKIEAEGYFTVDYKELISNQIIIDGFPEFSNELRNKPEEILNVIGLSVHQIINNSLHDNDDIIIQPMIGINDPWTVNPTVSKIFARISNYEIITPLKSLKANYYGKFISVKGTVVRVSNIKPQCTKLAFECVTCGCVQVLTLPEGKYIQPTKCPAENCRSRSFYPKRDSELTELIDWQTIRVQEIVTSDHRESGRIPRIVDIELTADLVDSCVPGDMATISGIVKVLSADSGYSKSSKDKCMFSLYIFANSVTNAKGKKSDSGSCVAMDFSNKELYAINEIHSEDNIFRLLVGSLCPSIYGHEIVKAGLLLGLFGGSQKYSNDKNHIPVRGDSHILVVGDPGLGKSQMLQATANIAPRSVYVCGNTTTTSGLTVTMCKESGSGDFALEAGALVLSDQGCCCIDEFDKMGTQHAALLEAMEQQSISIAKAGIVCSLPARTAIIAAANPIGGHYNKAKTVSENLKMGSALLSRFDLVFIMLDRPDEEMDSMLSEYVMSLHAGKKQRPSFSQAPRSSQSVNSDLDNFESLTERLKVPRGEAFDPIPPQLLRKYIGYARIYVHPKIGQEAAAILQKFYLDLRKNHKEKDSTPVTTRQLESLIRLTEARARAELKEVATAEHATDVIEIMKNSMIDTYSNELGFLDFQRSQHGSGMSSKSQAKRLISIMQQISERTYNSIFTAQQMKQIAKEAGIQVRDFEGLICSLNNQGYLLQKGNRVYQLQVSGF